MDTTTSNNCFPRDGGWFRSKQSKSEAFHVGRMLLMGAVTVMLVAMLAGCSSSQPSVESSQDVETTSNASRAFSGSSLNSALSTGAGERKSAGTSHKAFDAVTTYFINKNGKLEGTDGSLASIADEYQVVGPYSDGLVLVRWVEISEDSKWNVNTDGVIHYGFMDPKGEMAFTLEDVLGNIGFPPIDDRGKAIAVNSGCRFVDGRASLELSYGGGSEFKFFVVVDKSGKVLAYAAMDPSYILIGDAMQLPYTSFPDPMKLQNFPSASIRDEYCDGILVASLCTSMGSNHYVLLDADGGVYANFFHAGQGYSVYDYINATIGVTSAHAVCTYTKGEDAHLDQELVNCADIAETEGFDKADVVGVIGSGTKVCVNGMKQTSAGKRVMCGIFDAASKSWVGEPVLGGTIESVHDNCCMISIEGGYNQSLSDGVGFMLEDGNWLVSTEDTRLCDVLPGNAGYLADGIWFADMDDGSSLLFDAVHPNLEAVNVSTLSSSQKDGNYSAFAADKKLYDAANKK